MWMGRASDGRVVDESGEKRRVQGRTAKSLNTNGIRRRTASTKVPFRAMRSNRGCLEAICLRAPRRSGGQWSSVAHPAISPVLVDRPRPIVLDPRSLTSPHRPRLAPNHSTAPARSIPARYSHLHPPNLLLVSRYHPRPPIRQLSPVPSNYIPSFPRFPFRSPSQMASWKHVPAAGAVPAYRLFTANLEKPSLDDRQYRVLELQNGLRAVVIHDPDADKAAACLALSIGNMYDPVSFLFFPASVSNFSLNNYSSDLD